MKKVEHIIVAVNHAVVAGLLAISFAIVFMNVVGRYGFGISFSWVEEAARHLMILASFCGAGLALREGRLVTIGIVSDMLPERFSVMLRWAVVLVMFAFMIVMCWLGVQFVQFGWNKETMATGIPRGIPYMSIPIGCALFLIQLCFFAKRFVARDFEYDAGTPPTGEAS